MKNYDDWIKKILLIAGSIELIAGLSHAVMPHYIYKSVGFSLLQSNEINIITLCVFSVGILLAAFGALTIIFAIKCAADNDKMLFYFVSTKAVLWATRIALEFLYPTKIAMFAIEQPTVILTPIFIFIFCLFILSGILIFRSMNKKTI
jgi:hypothetical protein